MERVAKNLYTSLPVSLQNLAISTWGIKSRRQRYGKEFYRRLEWLRQSEWWSADQMRDYQNRQVHQMVSHAYQTVPAYRERYMKLGISPDDITELDDLTKLPIITKQDVKLNPTSFLSTSYSARKLRKALTSGTTGSPLTVYLTHEALQFQWAVWWRHRSRYGLQLGDRFLMFGARLPILSDGGAPPYWRINHAINQVYLSTYHLTPRTMPFVMDWLKHEQFQFFTGYPSAMYVLAQFILESGRKLANPPKYVVSGSDALIPAFERIIGDAFESPVTDQYGSAEACGNFARCEHNKYHLDAEFCAVDLLPVQDSEDSCLKRLIFTGFANPAMPLIRYDQGDLGLVSETSCLCGRHTLTVDRIEGRTEDFVRTPDGRMAIGMNQVFEWTPNLIEAQIRQDSLEAIDVLVVPSKNYNQRDERLLEQQLRDRLGDEIVIDFHLVASIPRTKAGKFRAVISNIEGKTEAEKALSEEVGYTI